jgi:hypothetical protein
MTDLLKEKGQNDPVLAGLGVVLEDLQERGHGLYMGFAGYKSS